MHKIEKMTPEQISSFHTPFSNMERAIENLIDNIYDATEKDFLEKYDPKDDFIEQLFEHNLYELVVLMNHGDDDSVLAWIETFREKHNMVSDCEEDEDIDTCYGKHCCMTADDTPLKMVLGWNRELGERFTENLYCINCEERFCYIKCSGCHEMCACDKIVEKPSDYPLGYYNVGDDDVANFYCKECVKLATERNLSLW